MLDEKTLKAHLIFEESRNIKKFLMALIQSRYRKMFERVVEGKKIPKNHLTLEEEVTYSGLLSTWNYMGTLLKEILQERRTKVKEIQFVNKPKRILIRFLKSIPAIIGPDMKTYGPFKVEDIASLQIENVEILVKRGVAVEVDIP
jgi:DNA replication factor GINS